MGQLHLRAELRSASIAHGVQCVMMAGEVWMLELSVHSWDLLDKVRNLCLHCRQCCHQDGGALIMNEAYECTIQ